VLSWLLLLLRRACFLPRHLLAVLCLPPVLLPRVACPSLLSRAVLIPRFCLRSARVLGFLLPLVSLSVVLSGRPFLLSVRCSDFSPRFFAGLLLHTLPKEKEKTKSACG
jgi:hypothetical protein